MSVVDPSPETVFGQDSFAPTLDNLGTTAFILRAMAVAMIWPESTSYRRAGVDPIISKELGASAGIPQSSPHRPEVHTPGGCAGRAGRQARAPTSAMPVRELARNMSTQGVHAYFSEYPLCDRPGRRFFAIPKWTPGMKMPAWSADKVERRPVAGLVPYARNARQHTDARVAQI
jgi:hypothetical protein